MDGGIDNRATGSDTRDKILEAALDLFASKGYHGTSMREIASMVDIQKSSIYNHFAGKKDIFEKLLLTFGPGSIKNILTSKELKEKVDKPYEFLQLLARKAFNLTKKPEEQKFIKLVMREHDRDSVKKLIEEKIMEEDRKILAGIFRTMMEKGLIKEYEPLLLATEFIGFFILLRIQYVLLERKPDTADMVDKHIDFFWQAVKID
ncbi:MAG: hypothetical protein PWR10_2095 [Halanaerobiales bacterium]|nr:hypothetical protein [Halanaerobiales bacterium]